MAHLCGLLALIKLAVDRAQEMADETKLFTWVPHLRCGIGHHLKLLHGQLNHNFKVRGPPFEATPGHISPQGN